MTARQRAAGRRSSANRAAYAGFSLIELMIALTILAVGLLALAQLQIISIRGGASSRRFTIATNLAKQGIEQVKGAHALLFKGSAYIDNSPLIINHNNSGSNPSGHNDDDCASPTDTACFAPEISTATNIGSLQFDMIEVVRDEVVDAPGKVTHFLNTVCGPQAYGAACAYGTNDFVRLHNVRNRPTSADIGNVVDSKVKVKEVNVMVLWSEDGLTHGVNLRTFIGRKDSDFF